MIDKIKPLIPNKIHSKFTNRPVLQKIMKNIGWLTFDQFLRLFISVLVGIWVARHLGPSDYGLLSFAIAFVSIFSTLSSLGLSSIVLRDFVRFEKKKNLIFGSSFILRFIASWIFFIISLIVIVFLRPEDQVLHLMVFLFSLSMVINSFDIIGQYFNSRIESKLVIIASTIGLSISTILKIYFILFNFPVFYFALSSFIEGIIVATALIVIYKKQGFSFNWKFDKTISKKMLSEGFFLLLAGISAILYLKIDQIMIGILLNDYQLGIYSVAVKLSEIWYVFPSLITASFFPILIKSRVNSELFFKRLSRLSSFLIYLALIISVIVFFFSEFIISFLYGFEYIEAAPIISIYIWASLFVFFGYIANKFLLIENLSKIILAKEVFGAIINIFLNLLLIPTFGIIGAAIATLISYSIAFVFSLMLFKKTRFLIKMFFKSFNPLLIIKG